MRRRRGPILCCLLLRFGQRAFELGSRSSGGRQLGAQLGLDAGDLVGGRSRVGCALLIGSLEGGRGCRLPLECGAGGGVLRERGIVSRLKGREPGRGTCQLRGVPLLCLVLGRLNGCQALVKTGAPVSFLSEQAFEHRLTLVRGANVDGGALTRLLMRSLGLRESVFERGSCGDGLSQGGAELRFAPAETLGRGSGVGPAGLPRRIEGTRCAAQFSGERITRPRGLRQARRELHVPLGQLVGERDGLRRPPLVSLPERGLELEESLLQRHADPGLARQGGRVPGLYVGEPFDRLPARPLAFDGPNHCSGQVSLERGVGHHVSVGPGIECGERRLESRRSRHDDNGRRQAKPAQFLDERGAALRLHLDDHSRGVAVALQPLQSGSRCLGPAERDVLCNLVHDARSHESGAAFRCDVKDLHRGGALRFAIYRSMANRSALPGAASLDPQRRQSCGSNAAGTNRDPRTVDTSDRRHHNRFEDAVGLRRRVRVDEVCHCPPCALHCWRFRGP